MVGISRRDFLKLTLAAAGIALTADLPTWIDSIKDIQFKNLIEICTDLLRPDQVLDILDADLDLQDAIGSCFTFLLENGEDPEEFLIEEGFL
ncbi:MAG: hypothetical protein COU65_03105 [Candidatus Pacebacteria bacterium CG10_big_fil_rev_8_21_14_0_10_42_12]|nr:twin-arginine translocation signal domain-containing protein [Candidatus Paceibacterota bacterium]PIR62533.1 MAG: hypothetical protein COU65_03105 [Candidatus Pacebacteria bacterium CG10_big_fil_rev_8_21_14_0_10_42_12]